MKIFSGSSNKPLAEKIAHELDTSLSPVEIHVFPDGEKRIWLEESVAGEDVVIVAPTSPPVDENQIELCFLLDAAKSSGTAGVTAVVPYLGYQRQDHIFREGEARSLEVVIRMIEVSGATRIIGVDFHSIKIPELFKIDVVHASALPLFAEKIRALRTGSNACLVTPDMGGIRRIEILSELLGGMPYVSVEKDRDIKTGEVSVVTLHGEVLETCFIVDDMISSGKTIENAISALRKAGAKRFFVFATHAIFSNDAPRLLENSPAEKIYVTDSVYIPPEKKFSKLEVLSIAPTIAEELKKV